MSQAEYQTPELPRTLVEGLEWSARHPERGFSHLADAKSEPVFVPYAELHAEAGRVAVALQSQGIKKGDRVGIILPESKHFVAAMFGAMRAGAIAVPVYPPMNLGKLDNYLENTTHILSHAGCKLVITDPRVRPILGKLVENAPSIRAIETWEKLLALVELDATPAAVAIEPDDVAFLQFTSGSTSRPKGVMLTHANLVANAAAIGGGSGLQLKTDTVAVSWLPLFHDMGLIGFVFTPIVFQIKHVRFLSPLLFLKRPVRWLQELSQLRGEITFAPNFAWGLATRRIKDKDMEGLDLSCVRVAGCGAEPVHHGTLKGFADRFASVEFRSTAFLPCFGMAEHSLAVTFIELEDDISYDLIRTDSLAEGKAEPAGEEGDGTSKLVACGKAFPGHEVVIFDEQDQPLKEREVGQIVLRGPSVMKGYFADPAKTQEALAGGWLRTGDLGYLVDGELYVCGRIKDLIIINGRNYYPQDIEWQASQVDGVRTGNVIAFGFHDPAVDRERVVVLAESREGEEKSESIRAKVSNRVQEFLSLRVDEVIVLPAGSLPKTSSGKLQRAKAADLFQDDTLVKAQGGRWKLVKHLAASRWSYLKAALKG